MADLQIVQGEGEAHAAPAGKKKMSMTPLFVAGGVVVGLALGFAVVGPIFDRKPEAMAAGQPEKSEKKAKKSHGKEGEKGSCLEIDNVVVNPAGAEGVHFLMVSVTIEVDDKKAEEELRAQEHIVRDLIVNLLSGHTLADYSRAGVREAIKKEIAEKVQPMVGDEAEVSVYLPQFVVQ